MDTRTILAKIITLIYKTRLIGNVENDDLIRTVLSTIKTDSAEFNFLGNNSLKNFKEMCLLQLNEKEEIPKEIIIQQASIILENDPKLIAVIKESILPDHDEAANKRIVSSTIKTLNNYYKERLAVDIFSKVAYELKFNRNKIANFSDYLKNTLTELEPLANMVSSLKDPAVVSEVDFESPDSMEAAFEEVKSINNNTGIYQFGLKGLNKLAQGGVRRGEAVGVEALQHKYKTGSTLSMFMQIALHNKPIVTKEEAEANKKPLLLRISFEDSLTTNLQFMYQYLKEVEGVHVTKRDFEEMSAKDMSAYVMQRLTATGFQIKMIRVDPSQWTYSSVMNKIIELEAQGYAVHVLMVDYLLMMPTTGCTQGALGADKRDMVRRMRNFCSARYIAFMTPFQLSTEANQLLRNGVPDHQFVNEIAEKNYTDGCKTIGQELDLEIYVHMFMHKRKKYLAFRRGKHRGRPDIPVEDKFCMYKFPTLTTPVLEDINTDDQSLSKLPKDSDEIGSNLLEEALG
jgi:hypothetical protein